jgi:hypothetical protein
MERPWILDYDTANCSIGAAVAIIGERQTFLVLREAFNGVRRFDDIQRRTAMPRQVLSDRLARLVDEGLLRKVPYRYSGQRRRGRPVRDRSGRPAGPAPAPRLRGAGAAARVLRRRARP